MFKAHVEMFHTGEPGRAGDFRVKPMSEVYQDFGLGTAGVHAGQHPEAAFGARINPIYMSAGFVFESFDDAAARFSGEAPGHVYSRLDNPSLAAVERKIAALEHGSAARLVASGQAATHVATAALLAAGDHVLVSSRIYEGTRALFRVNYARYGVQAEFVENPNDPSEWRAKLRENTKLLFTESVTNPKSQVVDIEMIAGIADECGVPLIVDNTVATPMLLRPIDYGADVVVHSASKFLTGQGAALGGVVIDSGRFDYSHHGEKYPLLSQPVYSAEDPAFTTRYGKGAYMEAVRQQISVIYGTTASPFNAFLLQQGSETLSVRIRQQTQTAQVLAEWLERQPEVASVDYSGLPSSPWHGLAQKYLPKGSGAILSFTLHGGREAARTVIDSVHLLSRMTHIGDVRSLILHPASTTHTHLDADEREQFGISEGLIRLSVGLEEPEDLITDLHQALAAVR